MHPHKTQWLLPSLVALVRLVLVGVCALGNDWERWGENPLPS